MQTPRRKAIRIRLKFLENQFLQNTTDDFLSTQNLERQVDKNIEANVKIFR